MRTRILVIVADSSVKELLTRPLVLGYIYLPIRESESPEIGACIDPDICPLAEGEPLKLDIARAQTHLDCVGVLFHRHS